MLVANLVIGLTLVGTAVVISFRNWEIHWPAVMFAAGGVVLLALPQTERFEVTRDGVSIQARVTAQDLLPGRNGEDATVAWLRLTVAGNPALDEKSQQTIIRDLAALDDQETAAFLSRLRDGLQNHDIITSSAVLAETMKALGREGLTRQLYPRTK